MLSYRWQFGDPQSVADTADTRNPSWTYPAPGTYTPTMIVTNQSGCRDTATVTLGIYGLPKVSYSSSLACIGQPTYFFDHSDPYLAPLDLWGWKVSDSLNQFLGTMQGATPQYVFDSVGAYRVLLTASDTNGCADSLSALVHARPSPLSVFSYHQNAGDVQSGGHCRDLVAAIVHNEVDLQAPADFHGMGSQRAKIHPLPLSSVVP